MPNPHHLLVFGATGAIAGAICTTALARGWQVTGVLRDPVLRDPARRPKAELPAGVIPLVADPLSGTFNLASSSPYNAVCWAQGANTNDSVYDLSIDTHMQLYQANVVYILVTLKALLDHQLLAPASRLCILSSIWQTLARQRKLSYCISKSALQGVVLSASADLAADGHLINAVLPGATDTPMTRRNLTPEQIDRLSRATGFNRLPSLADVAGLTCFLCSPENTGITGQFIAADLGFTHTRMV